jgi:hypothetical protein
MASFLKRLFGGKDQPPPQPAPSRAAPAAIAPAVATSDQLIAESRKAVRAVDRRREPQDWANAQQVLAANLVYATTSTPDHDAAAMLAEAVGILDEALDAAGPDADPGFLGSLHKLRGEALWRRASHLFEDEKGRALAEAANAFGAAMTTCPRTANYQVWVDSAFFRGAAFQELSAMKGGAQGVAWLDEAVALFTGLAANGAGNGGPHPIAAYNAYVVLEKRAARTERRAAIAYYEEARRYLLQVIDSGAMATHADHHRQLLAGLEATIADLKR